MTPMHRNIALAAIAECQKADGVAAIISVGSGTTSTPEMTYDMRAHGLKQETLLLSSPDTAAHAIEIAETLIRSGNVDLIVTVGAGLNGLTNALGIQLPEIAARNGTILITL